MTSLFPHETIRQGQDELMQDIGKAFAERKILLANAPTGLGKTAAALSVAVEHAVKHNKRVFFLTNRHTQHQIAINTLKLMKEKGTDVSCADVIGKRWMCSQEVSMVYGNDFNEFCKAIVERGECEFYNRTRKQNWLTVEGKRLLDKLKRQGPLHTEELVIESREQRMCSYEVALALAKKAKVIVGDYNYLFNPYVRLTMLSRLDLRLEDIILIVDEGHNLPKRVVDMVSSNLTTGMVQNARLEARKFHYQGISIWLEKLMEVLQQMAVFSDNMQEKLLEKEELMERIRQFVEYQVLCDELEMAAEEIRERQKKSYLGGIAAFLDAWRGNDQGFARILSRKQGRRGPVITVSYICLDPSSITKDIFAGIHAGVVMSGTLTPTEMHRDVLGIERGIEKEYLSPFPLERKLSLIVPLTTTKYSLRNESMYHKIAETCSRLAELIPGNVAFFFPSYSVRDSVGTFLSANKKLFWEKSEMSKEEKEDFLNRFRAENSRGGILLGVSGANFAEGIDLPGDLLNGVVVVGLPLATPDLKTKEGIRYYDHKFGNGWNYGYVFPAISKCLQGAGRCIRSEKDKGAVIFLDERFAWPNYFCCFPSEGLIVSREYEKLLKEFFK